MTDVADPRAIAQALPDARPTVFLGVPRVWHKIKVGIETKLDRRRKCSRHPYY